MIEKIESFTMFDDNVSIVDDTMSFNGFQIHHVLDVVCFWHDLKIISE
jgi:hypothetical protein